jgi:hypothetical protein
MPQYGTGALYGVSDSQYLRVPDSDVLAAQARKVRTTGLRVKVVRSAINQWEYVAGSGKPLPADWADPKIKSTSQTFYGYRSQVAACVLSNDNIVRVRLGDGVTESDRQIYSQTITDPTNASQWTSWSVLYSGTHYAVAVVANGASAVVYSAKSDGIYKNNTKQQSITGVVEIQPIQGRVDSLFMTKVGVDADHGRVMDLFYSEDIVNVAPTDDALNFRWVRTEISALRLTDARIARAQVANFYSNPRGTLSEALTISFAPIYTSIAPSEPPVLVRGFSSLAGSNAIYHPFLTKLSDGFYYLFYSEVKFDASKDKALEDFTIFWQRSKDLRFWTEPVSIGDADSGSQFKGMSPTNFSVVERSGYVYLMNNGACWRRPSSYETVTDISNYVNEVTLEMPSGTQDGVSSVKVAGPGGVNDWLDSCSDYEVTVEAGIVEAGEYHFTKYGKWWIDRVNHPKVKALNRINLSLYDLWGRLSSPLRDVFNFIGQVDWHDWQAKKTNKLVNYYFRNCKPKVVTKDQVHPYVSVSENKASSFILYTGWKGHNCTVSARFRDGSLAKKKFGVVYRYKDDKNYYWAYVTNAHVYILRVLGGKATIVASAATTSANNPTIKVVIRWGIHKIYVNDTYEINYNETTPSLVTGYSGVRCQGTASYGFYFFNLESWERSITTADVIKTALAMGDIHDVVVDGIYDQQLALVWGPQTDLPSPAEGLRNLLSSAKMDVAWVDGQLQVGAFKSTSPVRTLRDEVLESAVQSESGRNFNMAIVDGREDTYTAIDGVGSRRRGRQIVQYTDQPDLKTRDSVVDKANQSLLDGIQAAELKGKVPLQFDVWKMDPITWVEADGTSRVVRITSIELELLQGESPKQTMSLGLGKLTSG